MTTKTLAQSDLANLTGSERWFRHSVARHILYTEGVQHVAEHGGAYWLIDEIVFAQAVPAVSSQEFQMWRLAVNANQSAILTCDDGNGRVVFTKSLVFTDFPLPEVRFYFTDNTILLTNEY